MNTTLRGPDMDLKDWKDLEREAENQWRAAYLSVIMSEKMYQEAIVQIKKLGGMTNREEAEVMKKETERRKK